MDWLLGILIGAVLMAALVFGCLCLLVHWKNKDRLQAESTQRRLGLW